MAHSSDKELNFTRFGKETEFYGTLSFTDNLEIAGKFEGTIKSTGTLEIAKSAICSADIITAESIYIDGIVSSDMRAEDTVEMRSGSKITGDVTTSKIRIDDNVDFDGEVSMLEDIPNVDIFKFSASELREVLLKE